MKFEEILPALRGGKAVRRKSYHQYLIVFQQLPSIIIAQDVDRMKSLPQEVKKLLEYYEVGINYHDQFIMYSFEDNTATSYSFDGEDLNADDWEIVSLYDPYE